MGISVPEETMVAVKLSGAAARTGKPVKTIPAIKKDDTRCRMLIVGITPSSLQNLMHNELVVFPLSLVYFAIPEYK